MSGKYYAHESKALIPGSPFDELRGVMNAADEQLTAAYGSVFRSVIDKISRFGGLTPRESEIKVISSLQDEALLRDNTSVIYGPSGNQLPEDYNGLGYMNLIAMILEIEITIGKFKETAGGQKAADINLLFIEEPEAHTHPQMQHVFIKNIKQLLTEHRSSSGGLAPLNLQTVITTHSSHIASESDFADIKYFLRSGDTVRSKNMKDLEKLYASDPKHYQFLKQYLTLTRAELFFADKAVLIEGDTERILMSAFMRKIDTVDEAAGSTVVPLMSQNVSVVEVGAYAQIFDSFIEFIGLKTLIFTDMDSVDGKTKEACPVAAGKFTSNSALLYYFSPENKLETFISKRLVAKQLEKDGTTWKESSSPLLMLAYQTEEFGYHARSFEDAFIHLNLDFVKSNAASFRGIKNVKRFTTTTDAYELAEQCVKKKTHFALDILFFSDDKFSNWKVPAYIEEGLRWLKS